MFGRFASRVHPYPQNLKKPGAQVCGVAYLASPNSCYAPSAVLQRSYGACVASLIISDFGIPISDVGARPFRCFAPDVPMPEAAVYEQCEMVTRKDQVRPAW